ncbi:unnamed protein product (mitochondrion) [Arabidopsis thaliana]|uniref:(thale cress) hypothetical protein n=1 Tax=Arabidopsis thaliana TaxID=3702 RepID=A0A7G2FQS9_ARATH|nr:unnamed protein product [Arabidopsis thaliana]CAD5336187.1 unnamed protein product [Arabidopsis thaliana]
MASAGRRVAEPTPTADPHVLMNASHPLSSSLDYSTAGRIATDESRSAADSPAVGFVPQDSATGTRSEESTAAFSTHLYLYEILTSTSHDKA